MTKNIILIVVLSAVYFLVQGSEQHQGQQYKSHLVGHELIWRGKVALCSEADSCLYHNGLCPPSISMNKTPADSADPGIHSKSKTENDTLPQLNKSLNESRLGILEYLVKWINLVMKLS